MKQFTLKINGKLGGIRESSVSLQEEKGDKRFDENERSESYSVADAIKIKQLNGRIKMLELELQKAREDSFKVGFEEGRSSCMNEANSKVDAMRIELQSMELKYLETVEQIEIPMLELSKKMAQEVLGMELKHRDDFDEILFERLRKMMYEVVDQNKVIVEVNSEHLQQLSESDSHKELNLPQKMEINYIANNTLKKGEAKIQSEDYFVDGTFKEETNHIHDQLRDKNS